jgi:hypothetical protein
MKTDFAKTLERAQALAQAVVHEGAGFRPHGTIEKFENDLAFLEERPYEHVEWDGNVSLNAGLTIMIQLLGATATPTAFSNAAAYLGVGDGGPAALGSGGTTTFTNGSTTVAGASTNFVSDLAVNDWLLGPDGVIYQIASITNGTSLTLASSFAGTTTSGFSTSKILRELATQTTLQAGTNKTFVAMAATYPQVSAQTITWQSAFGTGSANYAWREFGVANGAGGTTLLNRKVSYQGTKASGQTWTLNLAYTVS